MPSCILPIKISEADYLYMRDAYLGICIHCGNWQDTCEPDADKYTCDDCGNKRVYGIELALVAGYIDIDIDID